MFKLPVSREGRFIYDAGGWVIIELYFPEEDEDDFDFIVDAINKHDEYKNRIEELEEEVEQASYDRLELLEQMDD